MKNQEKHNILKKIESILGYQLPCKFVEFYLNDERFVNNIEFLDINSIYNEICTSFDEDIEEDLYEIEPANAILAKSFDEKRLPLITDGSGNYIGIDFNPGTKGIIGQIINYGRDEYTMKVLANSFEDFVEGLKQINITEDIYVVDYLFENNLNFRRDIINNDIKKIQSDITESKEIFEEKKNEVIIEKEVNFENIKEIINILSTIDYKLRNNIAVRKYQNIWFDHRIINKRDSLSRTMPTTESFYEKLNTYNTEEIKGYSFAILNEIEEKRGNQLYMGQERIFVEINLIKKQVLIRYTETIKNQVMLDVYNEAIRYVNNV